jgi:hypothetical protein
MGEFKYFLQLAACRPVASDATTPNKPLWHENILAYRGGLTFKRQGSLAARVPASDSCQLQVRAGSVKVVFACTSAG